MKLDFNINNKKNLFINMQQEVFTGNVLDIGMDNYGIVYNLYKKYNDEASIEYIHGKEEKNFIEKNSYDSCIMLFSLSQIWFNKNNFIKDVSEYLKENGTLYIWDINKGYSKIFNAKIKVLVSDKIIKEINISDFNIFKDNSKETVIKVLEKYFKIIDLKSSDNIYYIRCQKKINKKTPIDIEKGSKGNEDSSYRNKLKVYSHKFSNKIFKSIYK